MKRILFQTGGPWHPVDAQAALVRSWLPGDWRLETAFGNAALDGLADADLRGAGRTASLANGHALESMEPPAIRQLWLNTLHWLLRA